MLGPVMVWMHYEYLEGQGHGLSIGQRPECNSEAPCSPNCGWASLTRLIHRPEDWEGVEPREVEIEVEHGVKGE